MLYTQYLETLGKLLSKLFRSLRRLIWRWTRRGHAPFRHSLLLSVNPDSRACDSVFRYLEKRGRVGALKHLLKGLVFLRNSVHDVFVCSSIPLDSLISIPVETRRENCPE